MQWGNPVNQELSRRQVIFWSNWNTRENMAYPLKPMAWSFFNDLLVPVIGDVLYGAKPGSSLSQYSQFIDLVNGRAYWNMSMLAGHPLAGRMIMPHLDKLDREAAAAFSELQKRGEFVPATFPIPWHQLAAAIIKGTITFISFPWLASPRWIEKRCQRFLVQAREYVELPLEKLSIGQMLAEARRYALAPLAVNSIPANPQIEREVPLDRKLGGPDGIEATFDPPIVKVTARLESALVAKSLGRFPILLSAPPDMLSRWRIVFQPGVENYVELQVQGPGPDLERLLPQDVRVELVLTADDKPDPASWLPGRLVVVGLPPGVKLTKPLPTVNFNLEKQNNDKPPAP